MSVGPNLKPRHREWTPNGEYEDPSLSRGTLLGRGRVRNDEEEKRTVLKGDSKTNGDVRVDAGTATGNPGKYSLCTCDLALDPDIGDGLSVGSPKTLPSP